MTTNYIVYKRGLKVIPIGPRTYEAFLFRVIDGAWPYHSEISFRVYFN